MIVSFRELKDYRDKVSMVDGGFDPIHEGHVAYFAEAAKLGMPVLCNVTGDRYVSAKHPVLLPLAARARVIDAFESVDFVHPNSFDTETVLRELRPRYYVKGSDWKGRLPREQHDICEKYGIEIVYVDSVLNSSSALLRLASGSPEVPAQLAAFESFVFGQREVGAQEYDKDYFVTDWREGENDYTLESRRRIEGRNPQLIKDVFQPQRVLDMGCGPGALICLLDEIGVQADGVDMSEECRALAPGRMGERIQIGSVTDIDLPDDAYDLVVCREVLEHLTVLQVQQAVANMCRISSRFVYVTTRFHPESSNLFDVTSEPQVDPTHITLMNKNLLRLMFVLQGFRRRADLEQRMDWLGKNRVLVYEQAASGMDEMNR